MRIMGDVRVIPHIALSAAGTFFSAAKTEQNQP